MKSGPIDTFIELSYGERYGELIITLSIGILLYVALVWVRIERKWISFEKIFLTVMIFVLISSTALFWQEKNPWYANLGFGAYLSIYPACAFLLSRFETAPRWFINGSYLVAALGHGFVLLISLDLFPFLPANPLLVIFILGPVLLLGQSCWLLVGKIKEKATISKDIEQVLKQLLKFYSVVLCLIVILVALGASGYVQIVD